MKGCSTPLATRTMKLKTTISCRFTPVTLQLKTRARTGEDVGHEDRRPPPVGLSHGAATLEESLEVPEKVQH